MQVYKCLTAVMFLLEELRDEPADGYVSKLRSLASILANLPHNMLRHPDEDDDASLSPFHTRWAAVIIYIDAHPTAS